MVAASIDEHDILLSNQTIDYISDFAEHTSGKPLITSLSKIIWKPLDEEMLAFKFQTSNLGGCYFTKVQDFESCNLCDKIYLTENQKYKENKLNLHYDYTPEFHAGPNDEPLFNYIINIYGLPVLSWVMVHTKLVQIIGILLFLIVITLFVKRCKRPQKQKSS